MEPHRQRLGRLRLAMVGVALTNLVLGVAGDAAGKGALQSLGFDGFSAFLWGFLYGVTVVMIPVRPARIMVAVVGFAVIDGVRLVFAAEDVAGSMPWFALLLRVGFAALAVMTAFAASKAAEEAAWARRPPPFVAKIAASRAAARPANEGPSARNLRSPATVDSTASALRYVAKRCEVTAEALQLTLPGGPVRVLPWSEVRSIWVRMLPPDRPWDGQIVFDVVPCSGEPLRVFATTFLHWPQGGRPATSRMENMRLLAAHIAAQVPELVMDEATRAFAAGGPIGHLARIADLEAHDARYAGPP
jgi:hypothetical protein